MQAQAESRVAPKTESWVEQIRQLREDPDERYRLACRHLPLKLAFREAAVALRALIREAGKDEQAVEVHLRALYRLAAIHALVYARIEDQDDRGDGADASLGNRWESIAQVEVPYDQVGSASLPLLNKTDRFRMEGQWGAPETEQTPRAWFDAQTSGAPRSNGGASRDSGAPRLESVTVPPRPAGSDAETPRRRATDSATGSTDSPDASVEQPNLPKTLSDPDEEREVYVPPNDPFSKIRVDDVPARKREAPYEDWFHDAVVRQDGESEDAIYDLMDQVRIRDR
jgi:hypothetical protein